MQMGIIDEIIQMMAICMLAPLVFIQLCEMELQASYPAKTLNMKFKTAPVGGSAAGSPNHPCTLSMCSPAKEWGPIGHQVSTRDVLTFYCP